MTAILLTVKALAVMRSANKYIAECFPPENLITESHSQTVFTNLQISIHMHTQTRFICMRNLELASRNFNFSSRLPVIIGSHRLIFVVLLCVACLSGHSTKLTD